MSGPSISEVVVAAAAAAATTTSAVTTAAPASGSITSASSEGDRVNSVNNPANSMCASQLLRMKRHHDEQPQFATDLVPSATVEVPSPSSSPALSLTQQKSQVSKRPSTSELLSSICLVNCFVACSYGRCVSWIVTNEYFKKMSLDVIGTRAHFETSGR